MSRGRVVRRSNIVPKVYLVETDGRFPLPAFCFSVAIILVSAISKLKMFK